jgi:NTE family protein
MGEKKSNKKKVGLALSGGGWRGLAHVGVLKTLEKYDIPIDYVAGASAGALIGGLYCYYGNAQELEDFILEFGYKDLFKIVSDPKLKNGLIKGEKMIKYLDKMTDKAVVENLKTPFNAVASNILTAKPYYFKEGKLSEAIKASASIPFLFQPTKKEGMVLIDGGATENIPVNCVKEMGANVVIAVSVNTNYFPLKKEELKSSTKIAHASTRTMIDRFSSMLASEADILIEPKLPRKRSEIGMAYLLEFLEFVKGKDIIKIGERETEDNIEEILKITR